MRALRRIKSLDEEHTFLLACCHAGLAGLAGRPGSGVSAAEGADQAEKAMAVLRQAVTLGYRNPDAYRTESALDPLRNRPDFRALMMDLVFPTEAFAEPTELRDGAGATPAPNPPQRGSGPASRNNIGNQWDVWL